MRGLARCQLLLWLVAWAACGSTGMPAAGAPDATVSSGADSATTTSDGPTPDTGMVAGPDGPSPTTPEASATCGFERTYDFFRDGGLRIYQDKSKLVPPRQHTITRDRLRGAPTVMCARTLPCDTVDLLARAIGHPDVVEAMKLATKPHYGSDPRPVDGTIFVFQRDDGRGFSVGPGNVPAGVRALEEMLLKVEMESLAAAECAALR